MSASLTDAENTTVGAVAATVETLVLQPTLYCKNAAAQGMPLTLDPRLLYRGLTASLLNEVGQLSLQFGVTGALKRLVPADSGGAGEVAAAMSAGAVVALLASPIELIMIQQQRFGYGLFGTVSKVVAQHGVRGLTRGLGMAMARDALYVGGMLGATPVCHRWLETALASTDGSGSGGSGGGGGGAGSGGGGGGGAAVASLVAAMLGGFVGAVLSHPFDVIKTCMQGDLARARYGGAGDTARALLSDGGWPRLLSGVAWRTVNICATVWIANECARRLPPYVTALTRAPPPPKRAE